MKSIPLAILLTMAAISATFSTFAHDESEHKTTDAKPNCEAMKNMDMTKMKADDPVMMAMMKKCKAEQGESEQHAEHDHHEGTEAAKEKEEHAEHEGSAHQQ